MEAYVLDSLLRRQLVIDTFESFIWTERMRAFGDFQIILRSTNENRSRLPVGSLLAMNESYRVMVVETIEDSTDSEGRATLKIKGRSIEKILKDRIARVLLSEIATTPKWIITDTPAAIVRKIFHDICVTGVLSSRDIIPFVVEASLFPADTIAEPTETITVELEPMTVYDAIKGICDLYDMGFRLVRNFDASQLYWDVYMGSDRTTSQSTLAAVVFAPNLDNLQNTTALTTVESYNNLAHVITPVGGAYVYADGVEPDLVEGFDRRSLLVKADDITDSDPAVALAKMTQRGKEELAKHRRFQAFDGELNQNSSYRYGRDYNLGDLVELRDDTGASNTMQVTEQIFVSDSEGERSYPTLSINTFITPGSWIAWDYNQVWEDLGLEEYWADQA